jgi:hypothetical protein
MPLSPPSSRHFVKPTKVVAPVAAKPLIKAAKPLNEA